MDELKKELRELYDEYALIEDDTTNYDEMLDELYPYKV